MPVQMSSVRAADSNGRDMAAWARALDYWVVKTQRTPSASKGFGGTALCAVDFGALVLRGAQTARGPNVDGERTVWRL
jgi:hypothetical protein